MAAVESLVKVEEKPVNREKVYIQVLKFKSYINLITNFIITDMSIIIKSILCYGTS